MIRAIALDFDGIVLESVDIKTRAFAELFRDHPKHLDKILTLHREHGGVSRFEKFRVIYEDFLQQPIGPEELQDLGDRFSDLVLAEVLRCPFVNGAAEFLASHSARYPLFVVSGTPEEELRSIVRRRELECFFAEVYGSPATKGEILQRILRERRYARAELVFVGDAMTDLEGARIAGVPFVGRVSKGVANPFPEEHTVAVVEHMAELASSWPGIETLLAREHSR